jgi:hypothetical protein
MNSEAIAIRVRNESNKVLVDDAALVRAGKLDALHAAEVAIGKVVALVAPIAIADVRTAFELLIEAAEDDV